ncbi:hypothetical protein C8R48DRAFT_678342 [Suillus tomentosus]|nr:hypothetical protein C8R48DRAFT_678342 [Suillus tomentosus]
MSTSSSKSDKTLLSRPDDFSGVKGAVSFKTWWRQVRVMFKAEPKIFTDDKKKVLFATSCMKGGSAGLWADNYTEEQFSLPSAQRWSFVDFEAALKASFDDANAKHEAQHQLELLKQGSLTAEELEPSQPGRQRQSSKINSIVNVRLVISVLTCLSLLRPEQTLPRLRVPLPLLNNLLLRPQLQEPLVAKVFLWTSMLVVIKDYVSSAADMRLKTKTRNKRMYLKGKAFLWNVEVVDPKVKLLLVT